MFAGGVAVTAPRTREKTEDAVRNPKRPAFVTKIPPGYRDWKLITVAREAGALDDIRAVLGNDVALEAYRSEKLPFPDGTAIARIAWDYVASQENSKVFGVDHRSFVAGNRKNVQFMIKDSKRYGATGGWGFAQFDDGKPADETLMHTCFPCHQAVEARDYVFARYSR